MTIVGMEAWVTSAVDDKQVMKALVLAGSLRRVRTSKKLVVFTTHSVSRTLRSRLKNAFDLVILLEHDTPNGCSLENYAKVEGFSLLVFSKCVYLSPNTLVLKNCDDIFKKYGTFAALENGKDVDFSVYLFTPCLDNSAALENYVHNLHGNNFDKHFNIWIQNNIPNWEKLDEEYNARLDLGGGISKSLCSKVTIANFGDVHPLTLILEGDCGMLRKQLGTFEKVAVELCERIYLEDVQSKTGNVGMAPSCLTLKSEIYKTEAIAIVGMSFRLPGGNNVEEFWDLLNSGKEAIKHLPKFRWSREHTNVAYEDQDRKLEGGYLSFPVDEFDAKFFGISGKEAELLDPQQRLLHEIAWEALEDAMIDPLSLRGTQTGVFVGSWLDDYKDMVRNTTDVDNFRVYMGNSFGTGAARLSHFLETTGPSIGTESGCASAMVAVDMACKSLRSHDSSTALACGVNLFLKPIDKGSFTFVVAPDGRSKTFDEGANGFGRAEGCAVLVMKRLSDAVRDEDNIWGLIRGSAITQEGCSKSLGTPTVHCESLAMELALEDADVNPLDVSYIEAHGTGTPVGDPMEIAAITKAYSKGRSEPLVIGSVKTNIGHTESVSGITGIVKVLLSMKNDMIPKHLNLKRLNPAINLDIIPANIPVEAIPWPKHLGKPRLAGVSSFGITGTDGHAIIQEPPQISFQQLHGHAERPLHILKLSAKSPESFQGLLETYEHIFDSTKDEMGFADLAYSANTGRSTFNHRAVIIASDFKQGAKIIQDKSFKQAEVHLTESQLCFLFTGQGSQYPNMANNLYQTSPIFRDAFDKCDQVLANRYGINLKQSLWGITDDGAQLNRTLYSQTSIFCVECCLLKLWESWGVKPDYVIGHSLGEFAAAVAAGALDFEDALMLVAERSRLIDSLPGGKMLAIKANTTTVDKIIKAFNQINPGFWVDYAALNAPEQTVVAGDSDMIEEFGSFCSEKSLKTTVLAATHAFHSRHMEPVLEAYRKVAQTVKPPKSGKVVPKYISGMDGKLIGLDSINADYWVRHTREPVNFLDACKVIQSEGCSLFLEIGPHPVLSALTMMNLEQQSVTCLPSIRRKEDEWATMLDSLAKLYLSDWKGQIDWKGFDRYYKRSRVSVPFYPFNRKSIWKEVEAELPTVHPLLGKVIPTHCGHTIFESRLTLKNTSFTQDHVIGNTVVFPGAAFLEMCLAAGHATVQNVATSRNLALPQRPVVLKSLRIVSPLAMYDSLICRLQTTVNLDTEDKDEIRYCIDVTRYAPSRSGAGEWVSHAKAKFLPIPATQLTRQMDVDIPAIKNSWMKADNLNRFYERLPEVGLRFGPKFKSLEMAWKSEKGMLFSVKKPATYNKGYLIDPLLADAMIQATMLWTSNEKYNKKLQVPVSIGQFIWLKASSSTSPYIYCSSNEQGKTECILLDETGNRLALMQDVDFIDTSVKLMEGMIQQQVKSMPKLWKEEWKCAPAILQSVHDLTSSEDLSWLIFYNSSTKDIAESLHDKFTEANRKVRLVKRPSLCNEDYMKEMMKTELKLPEAKMERVEGILYLWGLSDDITSRDQSQISLPLINLAQKIAEFVSPPRLYVVTQGTSNVNGFEVTNPNGATLHGIINSLSNENSALHLKSVDLSPDEPAINQVSTLFHELWETERVNRSIAFRDGQRFCTKFCNAKVSHHEPISFPNGCDRFQLQLPSTRLISDLEFGILESYPLGENEVEVTVKTTALNFRDVFAVLKPIPLFEDINTVGLDFSGVVTKIGSKVTRRKIGDRVIGVNLDKKLSLPSHVKLNEEFLVTLPGTMTFAEGATLPAVFSTAFLCLIRIAQMKKGETVLIHTASGGVGLCAIQLAKRLGVDIIATAGSKRKQNYLRNLGVKNVFHSRTTEFSKQILEITNGNGVDIVLNSITGEGFKEASLSALAKNGRFIEMSKLNVWKPEEVEQLRPDVFYKIVDLMSLDRSSFLELFEELEEHLHANLIHPVPYERFDAVNIRGALTYLQKAKHIGKVVCMMPEVKIENSKITTTTPLFNEVSTYLVTGGLGGIGLEVVKWMLNNGAKHIAIASRSQPKPEIAAQLESWNKSGKHVEAFPLDIGDYNKCQSLFTELTSGSRGFPQLRGVMHAAGVLSDATLDNQTWDKFKYTYNPKVSGTWHLHDLTKDLLLEHFVVFSSIAASIGSPGQSNHAASNSFEDSLIAYRRSNGLPGTTVNWGNWGEIGIATEVDLPGIRPITTAQGMLALETFLKTQTSHFSVVNIDSSALATKLFPDLVNYLGDKRLLGDLTTTIILNSDEFWKDIDNAQDRQDKLLSFKNLIKSTLRNILKMEQDEIIDDLKDFHALGIDSLMMLEMKNGLQNVLGSRMALTARQLKDCNDTEALSNRLLDVFEGRDILEEIILPTWEELQELIQNDSILPDSIRPSEEMQIKDISLVETVLLTGPTGVLGPYILKELTQRPSLKKIYCLVRKIGKLTPFERLCRRLKTIGVFDQVDLSKVECIQGDITSDKFGLTDTEYDNLATNVDSIVNCAVKADHTMKYYKTKEQQKFDVRTVNVGGTLRMLEFAVFKKLKHVYHGSSMLNVITLNENKDEEEDDDDDDAFDDEDDDYGCMSEEYQEVDAFDALPYNVGYPLSKHVSEQLCRQATERGVPIKTFRHPFIGGDSKTGRCDYATNHVVLRWLAYLRLKCVPDLSFPMMVIPVDQCAKISLDVFFNPQAPSDLYNIVHPGGGNDQLIIKIAEEYGIHIKSVPITEFLEKLKMEVDDSPLAPFKKLYVDDEKEHIEIFGGKVPIVKAIFRCGQNPETFFMSRKLPQLIENYHEMESTENVMRRDLRFLKENGVFDKYGIKCSDVV